jgi:cation transport ATPase
VGRHGHPRPRLDRGHAGVQSLLRRSAGVDIIAVLAIVGALVLGEYLAGAVIGLMIATGRALTEAVMLRRRR